MISMYVAVVFTLLAAAVVLVLRDEPRTALATELAFRTTGEKPASPAEPLVEPPAAAPDPEPEPLPPEPPKAERPPPEPASRPESTWRAEPDPPQKAEPKPRQRSAPKPEPAALPQSRHVKKPAKPAPEPETRRDPRPVKPPEPKPAPVARKVPREAKEPPQQKAVSAPAPRPKQGGKGGGEAVKRPAAGEVKPPELPSGAVMTLSAGALGLHDVPVKSSASGRVLDGGVVHLPDTSLPWDGGEGGKNVYLAGHRLGWPGTGSHRVFYRLDELRRGDWIVLKDARGRKYRYRVTGSSVVSPGDSWVKDPVPGRDMLTLQTCTPIPSFEKRLIVRANRV